MTIEEMLHKRDFATNMCVAIQNQIGKTEAGVYNIEDFETKGKSEFDDFLIYNFNKHGYKVLIFSGWCFTKELYYKIDEFIKDNAHKHDGFYIMFFPEIITFIVARSHDELKECIKKLNPEIIAVSDLHIWGMEESDNAVEIIYLSKRVVKYFEEKPKIVEKIIEDENADNT